VARGRGHSAGGLDRQLSVSPKGYPLSPPRPPVSRLPDKPLPPEPCHCGGESYRDQFGGDPVCFKCGRAVVSERRSAQPLRADHKAAKKTAASATPNAPRAITHQ
jgi:hypothetical protein